MSSFQPDRTAQRVLIIGAGMAGLSCGAALCSVGHVVTLIDKARGPGGRMSTRRVETSLGQVAFDHGAQYFTARDPGFHQQVAEWVAAGVAAPWSVAGVDAWVGTPAMNAVIKALAAGQDVRWNTRAEYIVRQREGWFVHTDAGSLEPFDALVLAIPAEQALPFLSLHDEDMAGAAVVARSKPCWTAMFTFAERLPSERDILRDCGAIGWAARNSAKPARSGPEAWVVQGSPDWSEANLECAAPDIAARLLAELAGALGADVPAPITVSAHRWRYAQSAALGRGALWKPKLALGVCGDWLLAPRVECAWLSGQQLARSMADAPTSCPA
jgi:predicted NAD/FAD-dependent oxidoreductase